MQWQVTTEAITWITNIEICLGTSISLERFTFNICDIWLIIILFKDLKLKQYIFISEF